MKSAVIAALLVALCGCASTSSRIDLAQLGELRKGQTTVAEVVKKFGRPNLLSKNWDGTQTAAYAAATADRDAGPSLLPAMGAVMGGGSASRDTVVFYFDTGGVLTAYKATPAASGASGVTGATEAPRATQPAAAVPAQNAVAAPSPNAKPSSAPASASPARKPNDGLPSWLPSQIRDVRQ